MSKSPDRNLWLAMKARCQNPRAISYKNYGGRGISMCERWQIFENFMADMGPRPSPYHSLDRIDNDGNYEPSNCRWSTPKEQQRNTRTNVVLTWKGVSRPISEWAELLGCCSNTLYQRVDAGWNTDDVLGHPMPSTAKEAQRNRPGIRKMIWDGKSLTLAEWAEILGVKKAALYYRYVIRGWSAERTMADILGGSLVRK